MPKRFIVCHGQVVCKNMAFLGNITEIWKS